MQHKLFMYVYTKSFFKKRLTYLTIIDMSTYFAVIYFLFITVLCLKITQDIASFHFRLLKLQATSAF